MPGRAIGIDDVVKREEARLEVRPARLRDLLPLQSLQRRCFAGSQAYGLVTLLILYLWPRVQILIAWFGPRVAGCVVGDRKGDRARILNLCVDPDFRRRGIGTVLLELAESSFDVSDVTLMVEDKNDSARALYRRCGYVPVSHLRHYYGKNRHGILMQKRRG